MKKKKTPHPPKWATRLLAAYCRPALLEDLQGDLNEFFERNLKTRGNFMARLIYIIDVLKFLRSYTIRKPSLGSPLRRRVMLASYIKTSGRVIRHNKLFSTPGQARIHLLLAIRISSLGLFGMVIYTMERRVKEVSIRKVLGASEGVLFYLLSKGFLVLLFISALIALPVTWLFFEKVVLTKFAYHEPIQVGQLFSGLFIVAGIAFVMIVAQTLKMLRANPAKVLKNE